MPLLSAVFTVLLYTNASQAHSLNDSYLQLMVNDRTLSGSLRLAIDDLEIAVGLDANSDREIVWGEVLDATGTIEHYVQSRMAVSRGTQQCQITLGELALTDVAGSVFVYLPLDGFCDSVSSTLLVDYRVFSDADQSHRGIAAIEFEGEHFNQIFASDRTLLNLTVSGNSMRNTLQNLSRFIYEGIWHIWIGIDHVLFIVAMLFGVILHARRAAPPSEVRDLALEIIKLVTAFTIAHSVTLVLASLEWVLLPSGPIEAAIALTVVLSGINIIYPLFQNFHWQVAFVFGFIHGFGFANVLAELDLSGAQFAVGLLGFNVGVEIGQLAIVLVIAPLLYYCTRPQWSQRYVALLAGLVIANIGSLWFLERI